MKTSVEITLSKWRGHQPRLISVSGESSAAGAEIQALDSRSGWASLSDRQGRFTIPDLLWYPGAKYDLVVSADNDTGQLVTIHSALAVPPDGIFRLGKLDDSPKKVKLARLPGMNGVSYERYDFHNRDYYRKLYDELTYGIIDPDQRISAVNRYVAAKLNYEETKRNLDSPRRVLETGSEYCGHLAAAMTSILAVGGYPTRMIDMADTATPPTTHVVMEIAYDDKWHLYDPTFGARFLNRNGEVASYQDLRLDPGLISENTLSNYRKKYPKVQVDWLPKVYDSGYHHYHTFEFKCSQYSHAWWSYQNDLDYVPAGCKVLLAAAGIQPGSSVTYHLRRPGMNVDDLKFTTRGLGNSACVLNQEESPPIDLPPRFYNVLVDLEDGNVPRQDSTVPVSIRAWRISASIIVR